MRKIFGTFCFLVLPFFALQEMQQIVLQPAENKEGWQIHPVEAAITIADQEIHNKNHPNAAFAAALTKEIKAESISLKDEWTWEFGLQIDAGIFSATYSIDIHLYTAAQNTTIDKKKSLIYLSMKDKAKNNLVVFGKSIPFDVTGLSFKEAKKIKITKNKTQQFSLWMDGQLKFENQVGGATPDLFPNEHFMALDIALGRNNRIFTVSDLKITIDQEKTDPIDPSPIDPITEPEETSEFQIISAQNTVTIANGVIQNEKETNAFKALLFKKMQATDYHLNDEWMWEFNLKLKNETQTATFFTDILLYTPEKDPKKSLITLSLKDKKLTAFGKSIPFVMPVGIDFSQGQTITIRKSKDQKFSLWIGEETIFEDKTTSGIVSIPSVAAKRYFGFNIELGKTKPNFWISHFKITINNETIIQPIGETIEVPEPPPVIPTECAGQFAFRSVLINEFAPKDMIELYNTTDQTLNLEGWSLNRLSKKWILPASLKIAAKGYYVLADSTFYQQNEKEFEGIAYHLYAKGTLGISTTSNTLFLKDCTQKIIDQVLAIAPGSDSTNIKSMNLAYPAAACFEPEHWEVQKRTLGKQNDTIKEIRSKALELLDLYWENERNLITVWNQNVSFTPVQTTYSAGEEETFALAPSEEGRHLRLTWSQPWKENSQRTIRTKDIVSSCYEPTAALDFVYGRGKTDQRNSPLTLNEIMVHTSAREKYVEIHNPSGDVLNLSGHRLGYFYSGAKRIKPEWNLGNRVILPHQYLVITKSKANLRKQFDYVRPLDVIELSSFPNYGNDNIVLLSSFDAETGLASVEGEEPVKDKIRDEDILDAINYNEKMHHPSLKNIKDIALEKFHPFKKSAEKKNWSSASRASNYGSPTRANSILHQELMLSDLFHLENEIFSPKKPEGKNALFIHYNITDENNYVYIRIYDRAGNLVKNLAEHQPVMGKDMMIWRGDNQQNGMVSMGMYIIYIELYSPKNGKKIDKKVCTVADYL